MALSARARYKYLPEGGARGHEGDKIFPESGARGYEGNKPSSGHGATGGDNAFARLRQELLEVIHGRGIEH